jgi:hypothetical protein
MPLLAGCVLGAMLGWCFIQSIQCRKRIRYLESEMMKLWECVARGSLVTAMEQYYKILAMIGKCPECKSQVGSESKVVHTEDCKMLEMIERFDQLFGKGKKS